MKNEKIVLWATVIQLIVMIIACVLLAKDDREGFQNFMILYLTLSCICNSVSNKKTDEDHE